MDWHPPDGSALARISDRRARQFWDPQHAVTDALNEIAKKNPPQPPPTCCVHKKHYWDEAILFPAGARWEDAQRSVLWNGPVVRVIPDLEGALKQQP
jgi:hypothetical protein